MLGSTLQCTLTIAAEEVLSCDSATVSAEVTTTGSGLAGFRDAVIDKTQYETAILGRVALHL